MSCDTRIIYFYRLIYAFFVYNNIIRQQQKTHTPFNKHTTAGTFLNKYICVRVCGPDPKTMEKFSNFLTNQKKKKKNCMRPPHVYCCHNIGKYIFVSLVLLSGVLCKKTPIGINVYESCLRGKNKIIIIKKNSFPLAKAARTICQTLSDARSDAHESRRARARHVRITREDDCVAGGGVQNPKRDR